MRQATQLAVRGLRRVHADDDGGGHAASRCTLHGVSGGRQVLPRSQDDVLWAQGPQEVLQTVPGRWHEVSELPEHR